MKKNLFLFSFFLFSILAEAQYEQKVSITIASGIFKTFGKKVGEYEPMQMPNYGMGLSANGGLQFKINEHLSLSVDVGIMVSKKWSYSEGDNNNYLYWSLNDTTTGALIAEGENYLDIFNYSFDIRPKYYLGQDKKWKPFIYAGVNINLTRAFYEDSQWIKLNELNMLPPDDTGPYNGNLEKNFGIGFNPGFGLEYFPKERIGFYLSPGYYFIALNKNNFKSPSRTENFNAFNIQAGLRLYFIKSKDL
ncbi:MAG: hypothetical protein EPN88_01180 [Bacteroidetes bacterium]|nr:MAG: hypothetical protein EPN88_01180 [Bacteroidota bacterium]